MVNCKLLPIFTLRFTSKKRICKIGSFRSQLSLMKQRTFFEGGRGGASFLIIQVYFLDLLILIIFGISIWRFRFYIAGPSLFISCHPFLIFLRGNLLNMKLLLKFNILVVEMWCCNYLKNSFFK